MNCKCIRDIEKKFLKDYKNKKTILKASLVDIGFVITEGNVNIRTLSHVELSLDGQKKKQVVNMIHSYCPFCGKKQIPVN